MTAIPVKQRKIHAQCSFNPAKAFISFFKCQITVVSMARLKEKFVLNIS